MDVNVDGCAQLRSVLISPETCLFPVNVKEALGRLQLERSWKLSRELRFLKELEPRIPQPSKARACGLTLFSLENYPCAEVLNLRTRDSKLYFERECFAYLYSVLVKIWKDDHHSKKVVLTGNAGVGTSWFQVFVLRRLMLESPRNRPYQFVVRHVGGDFYLMDLDAATGYILTGPHREIKTLLGDHGSILYLYDPAELTEQPPMVSQAPSLASLSPRKKRIKEYSKQELHFLYAPVAEYIELECIAEAEKMDLDFLEKNFDMFGGIFPHALVPTEEARDKYRKTMDLRCNAVSADMLRSMTVDIDDDATCNWEGNMSGFVLSYCNISWEGDGAFRSPGLALTSRYVRQRLMDVMSFASCKEHLKMLAKVLKREATNPTGKDLAESVVQMLAAGPGKVMWQYQGVDGEPDREIKFLGHSKREINRDNFHDKMVNYPSNMSFPLADCVLVINEECWAVQTTWQHSQAFKLRTLQSFRELLKLPLEATLNILYVNPACKSTYERRHRDKYLAKGEDTSSPIVDSKNNVRMPAANVATMWENTRILIASAKNDDWHTAIQSVLGVENL